jgi:hypothetical protein
MEEQPDRDAIADEAVGQTHGTAPPGTAKEKEAMSPEEAARRNAPAPGAQASTPEKTAAALGERVGDAYADAGNARQNRQGSVDRPAATKAGSPEGMADRVLGRTAGGAECIRAVFRSTVRDVDCRVWLGIYHRGCAAGPPLVGNLSAARDRYAGSWRSRAGAFRPCGQRGHRHQFPFHGAALPGRALPDTALALRG